MSLHLVLKCDGTWGEERMACRGGIELSGADRPNLDRTAEERGWKVGTVDLCPAHVRRA